jgi:hypothetical protein
LILVLTSQFNIYIYITYNRCVMFYSRGDFVRMRAIVSSSATEDQDSGDRSNSMIGDFEKFVTVSQKSTHSLSLVFILYFSLCTRANVQMLRFLYVDISLYDPPPLPSGFYMSTETPFELFGRRLQHLNGICVQSYLSLSLSHTHIHNPHLFTAHTC